MIRTQDWPITFELFDSNINFVKLFWLVDFSHLSYCKHPAMQCLQCVLASVSTVSLCECVHTYVCTPMMVGACISS